LIRKIRKNISQFYFQKKIIRSLKYLDGIPESVRRDLFVKVHGILKGLQQNSIVESVKSRFILDYDLKSNKQFILNFLGKIAETLDKYNLQPSYWRNRTKFDYLLVQKGENVAFLLNENKINSKDVFYGMGYLIGKLHRHGFTVHDRFAEFILMNVKKPRELKLIDLFDYRDTRGFKSSPWTIEEVDPNIPFTEFELSKKVPKDPDNIYDRDFENDGEEYLNDGYNDGFKGNPRKS